MNIPKWVLMVVAALRAIVTKEVVDVIKKAAIEAAAREDWGEGEKTEFVLAKGREVVAATPTPWDDLAFSFLAGYYVKKYVKA